jgi:type I restriction enzyme R subunit
MVDHFHEQVLALNKIGGQARAMVVTSGIERAIQYFHAIRAYLTVTEASLNGFPSTQIADRIKEDPYRS